MFDGVGGLVFRHELNATTNCHAPSMNCGRTILLNTTFVKNTAFNSGSAILTSDPKRVLVSCKKKTSYYDFVDQNALSLLQSVDPKRLCSSWKRNSHEINGQGKVISTYGRLLFFSTNHRDETRITGNVQSGFVLESIQNGEQLPVIHITILDAFENKPAPTEPLSFLAEITSPDKLFQGVVTVIISNGTGNFSDITAVKPPGRYNLTITPRVASIKSATLTVHVRDCLIGEEPVSRPVLCQACGSNAYNFNTTKTNGCLPCPGEAICQGRYIVPEDGYWHKGPCHANIKQCIAEEACTYNNREARLYDFGVNLADCYINDKTLELYGERLCNKARILSALFKLFFIALLGI